MKEVKFYFELESKGRLANVKFYPEEETESVRLTTDSNFKVWKNEEFELLVEDPFDYKLVVFGVSGTDWKADLKIHKNNTPINFIQWEGTTGDTRRNVSERSKPVKNIPS